MRHFPLIIVLFCSIAVTHFAQADSPVILILGDSISAAYGIDSDQGWGRLLQQRLQQQGYQYRVINASISGDTTSNGLARLPGLLKKHRPRIAIIALGGNDGLRGLPLPQMQKNLGDIITLCRQSGSQVVLAGIRLPPNYGAAFNQRFARVYSDLARHYTVTLQPQLLHDVADHSELMQADGIHPTAAAQTRILDNLWPLLYKLLSD